jgi:hypothetical protein
MNNSLKRRESGASEREREREGESSERGEPGGDHLVAHMQ